MTSTARAGALASRRVLVVEDEYFLADEMAQVLEELGAQVVGPVPTLEKALAVLAGERVDAAVLDINLKGQAVYPVADKLREQGVSFVFATGYDQKSIPDAYKDVPRWEKPFRPKNLAKALLATVQTS